MIEIVVTTGTIVRGKLQSNGHQQQTNTKLFLQVGCPSCRSQSTEGNAAGITLIQNIYHIYTVFRKKNDPQLNCL